LFPLFDSLLNCFNPKKPHVVKKPGVGGVAVTDTISTNGVDIDEVTLDKDVEFSAWDFDIYTMHHLIFFALSLCAFLTSLVCILLCIFFHI
jgi:hypothetical protein